MVQSIPNCGACRLRSKQQHSYLEIKRRRGYCVAREPRCLFASGVTLSLQETDICLPVSEILSKLQKALHHTKPASPTCIISIHCQLRSTNRTDVNSKSPEFENTASKAAKPRWSGAGWAGQWRRLRWLVPVLVILVGAVCRWGCHAILFFRTAICSELRQVF